LKQHTSAGPHEYTEAPPTLVLIGVLSFLSIHKPEPLCWYVSPNFLPCCLFLVTLTLEDEGSVFLPISGTIHQSDTTSQCRRNSNYITPWL